jgi:hypothetical protein
MCLHNMHSILSYVVSFLVIRLRDVYTSYADVTSKFHVSVSSWRQQTRPTLMAAPVGVEVLFGVIVGAYRIR